MGNKYTNKNTKVTDDQVLWIRKQFDTIDDQIAILKQSKKNILKSFNITQSNLYIRLNALKKADK